VGLDPDASFGAGLSVGNQVAFDLIPDRLQINLQTTVGLMWNNIGTPGANVTVVPSAALGATVQF